MFNHRVGVFAYPLIYKVMGNNNKNQKAKAKKAEATTNTVNNLQVTEIDINNILVGYNPRQYFDETALNELADSIKQVGVIQPITVRSAKGAENMFEIVCGGRRYRASKLAGLTQIPAYIRECTDDERIDIAFIENMQREDVSEMETAEAIKALIDSKKEDFQSMAVRLGKSVKYIRDRYQLNNLIDSIKFLVNNGSLAIGKAVLLASYSVELQEKINSNYLNEDSHNNWLNVSYTKFAKYLDSQLNSNLNTAEFDKKDCASCSFNSAITDLFASENENVKCLNKECFLNKTKQYKIQKAVSQLEENPTYLITQSYSWQGWFVEALKEQGFEIAKVKYDTYPTEAERPERPDKSECVDEETKELDREEWIERLQGYRQELRNFLQEEKDYREELKELDLKFTNNEIENCFIVDGADLKLGYRTLSVGDINNALSETSETQNLPSADKTQIVKLQAKDKRNKAIKVENIVKDIKTEILKDDIDLSKTEGIKLEQDILFFYLLSETSRTNKKKFFNVDYPTDQEKFDFVSKMSAKERTAIVRDFIVSKLKNSAFGADNVSSQLLLEFCHIHFEKPTLDIELKYQNIYDKRKKSIDNRITAIQNTGTVQDEFEESDEVEELEEAEEVNA